MAAMLFGFYAVVSKCFCVCLVGGVIQLLGLNVVSCVGFVPGFLVSSYVSLVLFCYFVSLFCKTLCKTMYWKVLDKNIYLVSLLWPCVTQPKRLPSHLLLLSLQSELQFFNISNTVHVTNRSGWSKAKYHM